MSKQRKGTDLKTELVVDRTDTQETPLNRRTDAPLSRPEPSIEGIIELAVREKMDPAGLEKLFALSERMGAAKARREFFAAMTAFKSSCPPVPRRTENTQFKVNRDGAMVPRKYASLEDIADTTRGPLTENGLTYRWGDATIKDGAMTLTCIVSHVGGHSEPSAMTIPVESKAGCSEQQKYGTAGTYAQRYSLIQALGLTSCDEDADGQGPLMVIDDTQAANIRALIDETKSDLPKFLQWVRVARVEDIPQDRYMECVKALDAKRRSGK